MGVVAGGECADDTDPGQHKQEHRQSVHCSKGAEGRTCQSGLPGTGRCPGESAL